MWWGNGIYLAPRRKMGEMKDDAVSEQGWSHGSNFDQKGLLQSPFYASLLFPWGLPAFLASVISTGHPSQPIVMLLPLQYFFFLC